MRQLDIKEGQNILDLALQEYGSVDGAFNIINDNEGVDGLDHVFKFGDKVFIEDEAVIDSNVKNFYSTRELLPTTGEEDINGDFNNDFNNDFFII